jgi:hypothetical protein
MTTPRSAGWYDDPDGSGAERYFDGQAWTPQRRRKPPIPQPLPPVSNPYGRGPAPASPHVPPTPAGPAVPYPPAPPPRPSGGQYWHRLSAGAKIGWAVAVATVLVIIASIVIVTEPWHSQRYKECRAGMEREGYKGDELKATTDFCVNMTQP